MAIKLKAESWHYKFFKKQLPYTSAPRTLCPYFWMLVGLLVTYPIIKIGNGIDTFFTWLVGFIPKTKEKEQSQEEWEREYKEKRRKAKIKEEKMHRIGKFFSNIFFYGVLPIIGCILIYFIGRELIRIPLINTLVAFGICIVLAVIIVGIVELGERWGDKVIDFLIKIIGTPIKWCWLMIKAGYEKACPLVEWEGEVYKETERDYHHFN
jgi:hypothetical protein